MAISIIVIDEDPKNTMRLGQLCRSAVPPLLGVLAIAFPASAQEPSLPRPMEIVADLAPPRPAPGYVAAAAFRDLFVARDEGSQRAPFAAPSSVHPEPSFELDRIPVPARPSLDAPRQDAQAGQKPSPPSHTGFKAIVFDTASDFKSFPLRRSTWVILAIGGGAAAAVHPFDDDVNANLVGSDAAGRFFAAGKWIGAVYVQAGTAVGLYLVGRYVVPHTEGAPRTNKVSHLGFDMLRALIVSQALTQGIKFAVQRDRPTGECCAFPSGHASATFATASVLERHLGYRGSWPMFLIATYVAMSRLHDNRHFLSDVVFGASLGIASGWTVVGRHGRSNYALMPVPTRGGMMVSLTRRSSGLAW